MEQNCKEYSIAGNKKAFYISRVFPEQQLRLIDAKNDVCEQGHRNRNRTHPGRITGIESRRNIRGSIGNKGLRELPALGVNVFSEDIRALLRGAGRSGREESRGGATSDVVLDQGDIIHIELSRR